MTASRPRSCEATKLRSRGAAKPRSCEAAELRSRGAAKPRSCEAAKLEPAISLDSASSVGIRDESRLSLRAEHFGAQRTSFVASQLRSYFPADFSSPSPSNGSGCSLPPCLVRISTFPSAASSSCRQEFERRTPSSNSCSDFSSGRSPRSSCSTIFSSCCRQSSNLGKSGLQTHCKRSAAPKGDRLHVGSYLLP